MRSRCTLMMAFFVFSNLQSAVIYSQEVSKSNNAEESNVASPTPRSGRSENDALPLSKALENVEHYSSLILGADSYTASLEGRKISAGSIPNPELNFEMEKFSGTKSTKGYDRAEIRTSLSQTIELGGKRGSRIALAEAELDASKLSASLIRIDVKNNVQLLFNDILRLQELKKIHESRKQAAVDFLNSASKRFDAGIASPTEKAKAQVSFESARLDLQRSEVEFENAKSKLSVMWGEIRPSFSSVDGDLGTLPVVPDQETLIANANNNTQVLLRQKEVEVRKEGLELARSNAIPDLTVSGGLLVEKEDNSKSALVGLSMPIPIFQRNGGGVLEASKLLEQAKATFSGENQSTTAQIIAAYQTYNMRRNEAQFLQSTVLKSADQALEFVMRSFRLGRLNYLEVIEAQRTQFDTKLQYLEATSAAHVALIELEKLTKLEFHIK